MKNRMFAVAALVCSFALVGCSESVPQGTVGRVKTRSGWNNEVLSPGYHSCYGRDQMFVADNTAVTYTEPLEILVGGKVNLNLKVTVRCRLTKDKEQRKAIFENVRAQGNEITHDSLYRTYLQMIVQSIPRTIIGEKADIQMVVDNRGTIEADVRQKVLAAAAKTPLLVEDIAFTNYDWPNSITKAQERLVEIQMAEAEQEAQTRADLKKAEGDLKVKEAEKLVELKKAEAVAEGIRIVREELKDCPEYLQWHTVRAMSEAASGPNNAFIMFPYNMPGVQEQLGSMQNTALLDQVLKAKKENPPKPAPSTKPNSVPAERN